MNWIGRLFARSTLDRELEEEIQGHLAEKIDDLIAEGMTPSEARLAARAAFGNVTLTAERARDVWGWPALETLWVDVRYGWRQLRKRPGITAMAVLSSATAIGATTAILSVLYGIVIDPYPYKDSDRIVHLHVFNEGAFLFDLPLSNGQFQQFAHHAVLDGAMAIDVEGMSRTDGDLAEAVNAGFLSPNAFEFLGVEPSLGRTFAGEAAISAAPQPVVLSHRYWQARFNGDPGVLGQTVHLDRTPFQVIGVMPSRFALWDCDVYLPLKPSADPNRLATVVARLKPGITDTDAQRELQALVATLAAERPDGLPPTSEIRLLHLGDIALGQFSGTLAIISGAVALLLIIGCANVSILLLAQGTAKTQELAVRVAVGASRGRLVRQLLTESILISLAGAGLGVGLASLAITVIPTLLPQGTFPSESVIELSSPVLLTGVLASILTGVLFGLAPALRFSHPEFHTPQLTNGRPEPSSDAVASHFLLIAGQVALTVVLLAGAAATRRSFESLVDSPLDYDPQNITSVRVDLRDGTYPDWRQRIGYFERIRSAVESIPAIESTTLSVSDLPPAPPFHSSRVSGPALEGDRAVLVAKVSDDYFSTLRIPFAAGRPWTRGETADAVHVAVINAAMARRYWPNHSPLWQRINLADLKAATSWATSSPSNDGWVEVIGVVSDTPNSGLQDPVAPSIYVPYTLVVDDSVRLIVRSAAGPAQVARAIAERIHRIDPEQPVSQVVTGADMLRLQGWARERFTSSLFALFAVLAVLLSASGLYSVVSYVVSQRTQEFGVRLALGAQRTDMVKLAWSSVMTPTALGISLGLGLCRTFDGVLVQWTRASAMDPLVLGPVVVLVAMVTSVAALMPARRAASVDPIRVLRQS